MSNIILTNLSINNPSASPRLTRLCVYLCKILQSRDRDTEVDFSLSLYFNYFLYAIALRLPLIRLRIIVRSIIL